MSYDIDWIAESELYQIEYIISDNDGHSGKVSIEWLYEAFVFSKVKIDTIIIKYIRTFEDKNKSLNVFFVIQPINFFALGLLKNVRYYNKMIIIC